MKKIISLAAAALLAASAFSSCGAKESDLLTYKYNYDLSEYITLAEYKGLPAEGYELSITDEQIQQQILATRAYYSRSLVIDDRAAQVGDIVYIDYIATVDGQEFEGGSEHGVEVTIGVGSFIEEVENALVGTYAGDHLSVDGVFPEPYYEYPELSGKAVHFEIDVTEVRMQEMPEYTEEFVRAYLGYESKADYEEHLRELMTDHYMEIYYESVIEQIWPTVFENTAVIKYPEKELKDAYDNFVNSYEATAKAYGVELSAYISAVLNMTEDEFYAAAQEDAEITVKEEMICYAIARAENISISDEEYLERAEEYAVDIYEFASLEAFEAVYGKEAVREAILFDMVHELAADNAAMTYLESLR